MSIQSKKIKMLLILIVALFFLLPEFVFAQQSLTWGDSIGTAIGGGFYNLSEVFYSTVVKLFILIMDHTILNFGTFWSDDSLKLRDIWEFIRDLVNMAIVLYFMIAAFFIMLGDKLGANKKIVIFILIAAVFVNFSAFLMLAFIDISNALFVSLLDTLGYGEGIARSPFGAVSLYLLSSTNGWWNIAMGLIMFIGTTLAAMGLFNICIILVRRWLKAIVAVIISPISFLALCLVGFGGDALGKIPGKEILEDIYKTWKSNLAYIFFTPPAIILGLVVLYALFDAMAGNVYEDLKQTNPQVDQINSWSNAVQIIAATIVLILGFDKIAQIAYEFENKGLFLPKNYDSHDKKSGGGDKGGGGGAGGGNKQRKYRPITRRILSPWTWRPSRKRKAEKEKNKRDAERRRREEEKWKREDEEEERRKREEEERRRRGGDGGGRPGGGTGGRGGTGGGTGGSGGTGGRGGTGGGTGGSGGTGGGGTGGRGGTGGGTGGSGGTGGGGTGGRGGTGGGSSGGSGGTGGGGTGGRGGTGGGSSGGSGGTGGGSSGSRGGTGGGDPGERKRKAAETLGVGPNATQDEIKRAYKRAAQKHHPDKGGDPEKFKEINRAYQTLKDRRK